MWAKETEECTFPKNCNGCTGGTEAELCSKGMNSRQKQEIEIIHTCTVGLLVSWKQSDVHFVLRLTSNSGAPMTVCRTQITL
jgi:hypothetical protein